MRARIVLATLGLALISPGAGRADPASKTVSPVVVTPIAPMDHVTIRLNGKDEVSHAIMIAYPSHAYESTQDGRVALNCRIDTHGLAEWCEIGSETPSGVGFGKIALQMRPLFKLPPAKDPNDTAMRSVAVLFRSSESRISSETIPNPALVGAIPLTMVNNPVWSEAPTFGEVARAYPAHGGGVEGYAVEHCGVGGNGLLYHCWTLAEFPANRGFGLAAHRLSREFRLAPSSLAEKSDFPPWVDIPIRMPPPSALQSRKVDAPIWVSGFDARHPKVFPAEAAAKGLTAGRGVAHCRVAGNGVLRACTAEPGQPDGLGFSQAAVKLASTLKANLWSRDGGPVAGGEVDVGVELRLDPQSQSAGLP
ncbi:hypothetical protein [Phenylobacterium sp.]|uniref:hypothetical protein n=1 Tax=Phenylobacterium sp. TaxID=1871053 RepID=UPI002F42BE26